MSYADAARKTVRRVSDRVAPGDNNAVPHTMEFTRQHDGSGFMDCYDTWALIRDAGWSEEQQRAALFKMQQHCLRHKILAAEEVAAINTKYGVRA